QAARASTNRASAALRPFMKGRCSAYRAAAAAIDMPAVEAGDAEFDIAAETGEAHRPLDQIPDVAVHAVRQGDPGMAIAPVDRPLVYGLGQMPRLADAVEVDDLDLRQVRHVANLIAETVGDAAEHGVL